LELTPLPHAFFFLFFFVSLLVTLTGAVVFEIFAMVSLYEAIYDE